MSRKQRIPLGLFSNARAGHAGTHRFRDAIRDRVRKKLPHVPQFDMISNQQVADAAQQLIALGVDAMIVLSGDGGLHRFLTAVIPVCRREGKKIPDIIRLPCGTVNYGDADMGLIGPDPLRTLDAVLHALEHGQRLNVIEFPILQVNEVYAFACGNGFVANFMGRYEHGRQPGQRLGLRRVAKVVGGLFAEELKAPFFGRSHPAVIQPFGAELVFIDGNGEPHAHPLGAYTAMIASTLTSVGMHLYPTPRARDRSDHFQFVGVRDGFWELAANYPEMFFGLPLKGDPVDRLATEVRIRYTSKRPPLMADGDVYAAELLPSEDVIRIYEERIRFIRSVR